MLLQLNVGTLDEVLYVNVPKLCHGDGEEIERHGNGLAMEVAARQHRPIVENQRVVGGRVEFTTDHSFGEADRIQHGPMDLRHAAQRIRVLYAGVTLAMRFADFAPRQQARQQRGRLLLPVLPSRLVNAGIERGRGSQERLQRHRPRDVRRVPERARIANREGRDRGMRLRPIDEGDTLLGPERERGEPGAGQHRRGGAHAIPVVQHPLTDQRTRQCRQWSKIAAGADGSLFRYRRPEVGVQIGRASCRERV